MRKVVASTLALVMILSMFAFAPVSYAAASDISVVGQVMNDGTGLHMPISQITEAQSFQLVLTLNSSNAASQNITVDVDQSNFALTNGIVSYPVNGISSSAAKNVTLDLKHNGGSSNTLQITINEGGTSKNVTLTIPMKKDDNSNGGNSNVDTSKLKPVITINEPTKMEHYVSTINKPFVVKLDSLNSYPAKNVTVTIAGSNELPFRRETSELSKTITDFNPKSSQEVSFNVNLSPVSQSKVYEIPITVTYENQYGDSYSVSESRFIKVANFEIEPTLSVIESTIQNTELNSNTGDVLTICVANSGTREASDIRVTLSGFTADGVLLNKDVPTKTKYTLGSGGEANFAYSIHTNEIKESRTVTLTAKVDYIDELGKTYSKEFPVYIPVKSKDDKESSEGSRPKPIVASYNYGAEYAMAGEEFVLTVDIKNTSKSTAVKNAKITFESEDNVFTPVNSSNSVFVDYIPADGTITTSIPLKTKIDASVKIYKVTVTAEYEDGQGNAYDSQKQPYKESETLSVAVAQPTRLEFADPILPFNPEAGRNMSIEQEFFNMGKSTMYNMMVKLEGNFETNEGTYFVGNFDAGRQEYYSASIMVREPGPVEGKLIFSYEDALGQINTFEKEFAFEVMAAQENEFPGGGDFGPVDPNGGFPPMEEEKGTNWLLYGGIAGAFALVVIIVLVRRRIKRKREQEFLEADDE